MTTTTTISTTASPKSPPGAAEPALGALSVSVVIPARDEVRSIGAVVAGVERVLRQRVASLEVLVVDDGSADGTAEAARVAGARVVTHPYSIGNGAAVKTGIRRARGEVVVLMDADGQHDPEDLPRILGPMARHDMVVGARGRGSEGAWHRNLANRVYNGFASYITRRKVQDLTSGYRAVRRRVALEFLYLLPNEFSYPTTLTLSCFRSGYAVRYVPIAARRRVGRSKIRIARDGFLFLLILFKVGTLYSPLRTFLPFSFASLAAGLLYGSWMIGVHHHFSNGVLILLVTGLMTFLMSLIAQQVSLLRLEIAEARAAAHRGEGEDAS
ncbi:MAG: glycosyltransferase family 2 protein [Planctomycetes bacterium]|nr:glycosyltransferase family 2 protein [Planctomycetota bacterium]